VLENQAPEESERSRGRPSVHLALAGRPRRRPKIEAALGPLLY